MARFCTNCGATLDDDKKSCTECGTSVNEPPAGAASTTPPLPPPQAAPVYAQAATAAMLSPTAQPTYQQTAAYGGDMAPPKGSKYEPITTKGFIGIMLLMCIPIVGQLLMLIRAFGGCRKINKRNLARASIIMLGVEVTAVPPKCAKTVPVEPFVAQTKTDSGCSQLISGRNFSTWQSSCAKQNAAKKSIP